MRASFRPRPGLQPSDGVHKLVDEALGDVRLPDDALLVILADGAAQLVVVHGRPVLADAPQPGHLGGVLNFEDAWGSRRVQTASGACGEPPAGGRKTETNRSVSQRAKQASVHRGRARLWAIKPTSQVVVRVKEICATAPKW